MIKNGIKKISPFLVICIIIIMTCFSLGCASKDISESQNLTYSSATSTAAKYSPSNYITYNFSQYFIGIKPISDKKSGDLFSVTGITNYPDINNLELTIMTSTFNPGKSQASAGMAGGVYVTEQSGDLTIWSQEVNTSTWPPGLYIAAARLNTEEENTLLKQEREIEQNEGPDSKNRTMISMKLFLSHITIIPNSSAIALFNIT